VGSTRGRPHVGQKRAVSATGSAQAEHESIARGCHDGERNGRPARRVGLACSPKTGPLETGQAASTGFVGDEGLHAQPRKGVWATPPTGRAWSRGLAGRAGHRVPSRIRWYSDSGAPNSGHRHLRRVDLAKASEQKINHDLDVDLAHALEAAPEERVLISNSPGRLASTCRRRKSVLCLSRSAICSSVST
jgi:hypothetical protein